MARVSGKAGDVTIAAASVTGIKSWNIDYKATALESTAFDNAGVKAFIIGCTEWSGSFDGYKDGPPAAMGSSVAFTFKETQTAGQVWSGTGFIIDIKSKTEISGIVTYAYDFQGTGVLVIPTA